MDEQDQQTHAHQRKHDGARDTDHRYESRSDIGGAPDGAKHEQGIDERADESRQHSLVDPVAGELPQHAGSELARGQLQRNDRDRKHGPDHRHQRSGDHAQHAARAVGSRPEQPGGIDARRGETPIVVEPDCQARQQHAEHRRARWQEPKRRPRIGPPCFKPRGNPRDNILPHRASSITPSIAGSCRANPGVDLYQDSLLPVLSIIERITSANASGALKFIAWGAPGKMTVFASGRHDAKDSTQRGGQIGSRSPPTQMVGCRRRGSRPAWSSRIASVTHRIARTTPDAHRSDSQIVHSRWRSRGISRSPRHMRPSKPRMDGSMVGATSTSRDTRSGCRVASIVATWHPVELATTTAPDTWWTFIHRSSTSTCSGSVRIWLAALRPKPGRSGI